MIRTIIERNGPGAAKLSRTVLSGMLGMAARYDALDSNPVRDIERIETRRKKPRHS